MALIFDIKVTPGAGRKEWKLDKSGILKCYLINLPEQSKANNELVKDLAKIVGVPQLRVSIISGVLSRKKRIKIETDLSYEALLLLLGIERQISLF